MKARSRNRRRRSDRSSGRPRRLRHLRRFRAISIRSFEIGPAELRAIIGPNGVGKTLFLKALAGTQPRAAGTGTRSDETLPVLRPQDMARRDLSLVPQGRMSFPLVTVREDLKTAFAICPRRNTRSPRRSALFSRSRKASCIAGAATSRVASSSGSPSPAH
jgi:ABC-type branched-subunit amino acid transport system ATPase component